MFRFSTNGVFTKTEAWLKALNDLNIAAILEAAGQQGVNALASATPIESGLAAHSWTYEASGGNGVYTITWLNTDVENGFPVAIMLQYGYATGTGGYVAGRDYINPALKPIFDDIANKVWKAVISA